VAEKPADPLRPFWDFDDLDASEQRFRRLLGQVTTDEARAEVLTQLARVEGLRGRFDEGERLLQTAEALADGSKLAAARIQLERGRLHRSSGDERGARPLFESAFAASTPTLPTRRTWPLSSRLIAQRWSYGRNEASRSPRTRSTVRSGTGWGRF
jgi:ATP/maltotriose-dependent transcriptional regulator MalT